jgi:hypothetical protein
LTGGKIGIGIQSADGFRERSDRLDEIVIEDLSQGPCRSQPGIQFVVELLEPPLRPAQGVLGVVQPGSGAVDSPTAVADGFGLFGESGGQELLFGLGEFMGAEADLFFPEGLPVVFEPVARADDVVLHVVEHVAGAFNVKDQAGPEPVQRIDR